VAQLNFQRLDDARQKAPDLVTPQSVDEARGKNDIAKANLERTQTLLNYAQITAPFAGVITARFVDPGAFIPAATAGTPTQNPAIVTLMDFNRVRVQVPVPENETPHIVKDTPAKFSVFSLPGRMFEGKVTRTSFALDEGSKTMLAEIEMPNPNHELAPGMYATVQLVAERKTDALLVPVGAVLVEKAGNSVFILAGNVAKKTPVKTGFNDGTNVEVLDGMKPDQSVILFGKQTLNDGQTVNATEAK
jgi:membrane fusion protein (multidrug efflux system)